MNVNRVPRVAFLPVVGLVLVLSAACGGASQSGYGPGLTMAAATQAPARGNTSALGGPHAGEGAPQAPVAAPADLLIVYTGTLDLEVTDLRAAVDQATAAVAALGGHVAASNEVHTEDYHTGSITFRIPAARWSEALTVLRGIGTLKAEDTDSEDVTAQVVDLDARIANLRSTEAALQGIMTRAGTITDVLKVQAELTKVRSDIESMTAQRDELSDRAALATLEVRFNAPIAAASVASSGWDLGREVDSAVAALVRLGQGAASLGIWLAIVVLPVAIPVLLALYVAVRVRRRYLAGREA